MKARACSACSFAHELRIAELVPGDIIRLSAGDLVPADARLLKLTDLHVR